MTPEERRTGRGFSAAVAIAALLLFTAGCILGGDASHELGSPPGPEETTVIVQNTGVGAIAIYSDAHIARLATVMPGRQRCVELPNTFRTQRLVARPIGGGRTILSPPFDLRPGDGWAWSIGVNAVADRLSLVPSRPCIQS